MHHHVCQVARARFLILLSCKTCKPISSYIATQWINSSDKNINTQIEFQPRYQVWLVQVSLSHKMLISILHPIEPPRQEYPLALTASLRLHYKSLCFLIIKLNLEVFRILRKNPSWWKKVIVLGAPPLHGLKVSSEQVLASECVHTCEVVDSLVGLHFEKELRVDCTVKPVDVPVGVVSFAPGNLVI